MSIFSQVSFESPQITNLDNSIDIADSIGELYVVDSHYYVDLRSCCGRSELKYDPPSSQIDSGSLYLTRNKNRTTRHHLNRTIWFGLFMYVIDTINEMYASYLGFSDLQEH